MKNKIIVSIFVSLVGLSSGELTKVLVASGNGFLQSVEVLNIDESRPNSTCKNLPDLPIGLAGASGELFQGKIPIICGGYHGVRAVDSCDCFALQNGTWNPTASLSQCRRYSASTIVTNGNDETRELLLISGGEEDGFGSRASVEAFDGEKWSLDTVMDLPEAVWLHCIIQVNETFLLTIGGYHSGYINASYFYNMDEKIWSQGPSLNIPRYGHSCGIITWLNPASGQQEEVVVVAGGYNGRLLTSTELLVLNNPESGFEIGPEIPRPISLSEMIQFKNGVVIVGGGYGSDGYKLYSLDSPLGEWTTMPQQIVEKRRAHVAFLIPDEVTDCN